MNNIKNQNYSVMVHRILFNDVFYEFKKMSQLLAYANTSQFPRDAKVYICEITEDGENFKREKIISISDLESIMVKNIETIYSTRNLIEYWSQKLYDMNKSLDFLLLAPDNQREKYVQTIPYIEATLNSLKKLSVLQDK